MSTSADPNKHPQPALLQLLTAQRRLLILQLSDLRLSLDYCAHQEIKHAKLRAIYNVCAKLESVDEEIVTLKLSGTAGTTGES